MRVVLAALLVGMASASAQADHFDLEASRFRNELRSVQPQLSPGIASHLESELNRLERMGDRDQADRELRALEAETAYAQSGLLGSYPTLTGPRDGQHSIYAPSSTLSSPGGWRLPEPGQGWR